MENLQNSNPQAAAQQAQAQMIIEIVKAAGLDANSAENQKAAAQVLQDVSALQAPEREKERNALMREYGINPDEFKSALEGYNKRAEQLSSRAETLGQQEVELVGKFKKAGTIKMAGGLAGGAAATYGVFKKWLTNSDSKLKKIGGAVGTFVAATALVSSVVGYFTTKPVQKDAQVLQDQQAQLQGEHTKLAQEAQDYQYSSFRKLASGMLKSRVATKAAPKVEAPIEKVVKSEAAAEKSFTEKVGGEKAPADKLLEKEAPAISPDEIAKQKAAAEHAPAQIG